MDIFLLRTTTNPCSVKASQLLSIFSATDSVLRNNSFGYDSATVFRTRVESNRFKMLETIKYRYMHHVTDGGVALDMLTLWHSLVCCAELTSEESPC